MTRRDLLHLKHLSAFSSFMKDLGWTQEPPKGSYEVARFRHRNQREPLVVFQKLFAKEHLTVYGIGVKMAKMFLRQLKKEQLQCQPQSQEVSSNGTSLCPETSPSSSSESTGTP